MRELSGPVEGSLSTRRSVLDDDDPARPGFTRTRPGSRNGTSTYSALLAQVKEHGLLRRRTGFYWSLFGSLVAGLALAGSRSRSSVTRGSS